MISQFHSNYNLRNRIVNNDAGKPSNVFIKDITHKMNDESKRINIDVPKIKNNKVKKWEPKGKVQFQTNETTKLVVQGKKSGPDTIKKIVVPAVHKISTLGILIKPTIIEPVDMISMLSQITVKVPLSELFRIEEHKS